MTATRHLAAALACACALSVPVLSACGVTSGGSATGTGGAVGGTLTVAISAPATGMNPATVDTAFVTYTQLDYDPLIYRSAQGTLQPDLATSWQLKDGNRELDLTLRPGVTFSDGTPVSAAAVKGSLDYIRTSKTSPQAPMLAAVSSIGAPDATHVTIRLSAPDPMLPQELTQSYGIGQIISPKGVAAVRNLTASAPSAGAGPYVYDPAASVAGDHYTYTANPKYFAKAARQHYKKIVVKVIKDAQATLNALRTKQVQVATGDFSTVKEAASAGLNVAWTPFVWAGLNLIDRGGQVARPLGDVRVRQAINYAINRDAIAGALLGKYGKATDQPSVQGMDGYSAASATRYTYDPKKAKQLLAAAGYPRGFTLKVISVHFGGLDTLTEALIPQLKAVGITLNPTYVSDAQSYVGGETDKSYPAAMVGYGSQPMYIMGQGLFLPGAAVFNGFHTSSPQLAALFAKYSAAAPGASTAYAVKMEDYLVDNAWFAPVVHTPVFYYALPSIGGLTVSGAAPVATVLDWYPK